MSELRPMDAALDGALPDGVSDAVLNRSQLARALNTSENTIDRWMGDGMPVLEAGTNGRSYKFQLSACYAWRQLKDRERAAEDRQAEDAVRQMRLALIGGSGGDEERGLSAKERAAIYEAEVSWLKLARERGEVVPAQEVTDLLDDVFSIIRSALDAMPDRLARDAGLTGRQVEQAIQTGDDLLGEVRRRLEQHAEVRRAPETVAADNLQ